MKTRAQSKTYIEEILCHQWKVLVLQTNYKPKQAVSILLVDVYDPPADFVGTDWFNYTLANSEGSDSASVTIDVADVPAGGTLSLTATPWRDRGTWYVDLAWQDGSGTGTVDIMRGTTTIANNTANDGAYNDNLGKKAAGDYTYEVCEDDTGDCASAIVSF